MDSDANFMRQAISLAKQGLGRTAPNPPVGALLVKNSKVIGKGFHPKAGMPHAEIYAIQAAAENTRDATLYVTLEPCNHYGKTPPCTRAILEAGIKRVVVAQRDPNPIVAGQGIETLRRGGIEVVLGVEQDDAYELIRWYEFWMKHKRPYVILKAAMTLDGRIATASGDSMWISSEESRHLVHEFRNHIDAVLVGIGTVINDDPRLTCRVNGGRDPLRLIVDRDLIIDPAARCLGQGCLVLSARGADSRPDLEEKGVKIKQFSTDPSGRLAWSDILGYLGSIGLHALMVEGGSSIYSTLIKSRLVERLMIFIAPKILGGGMPILEWGSPQKIADAFALEITDTKMVGGDVLIDARPGE